MGREKWTQAQPQNTRPTIYPACKMCWNDSGVEIVGVVNKCVG